MEKLITFKMVQVSSNLRSILDLKKDGRLYIFSKTKRLKIKDWLWATSVESHFCFNLDPRYDKQISGDLILLMSRNILAKKQNLVLYPAQNY